MISELQIMRCNVENAEEIAEVAVRAYRDHYLYLWNDDGSWYVNRCFNLSQIKKEISNNKAAFFLLKEKGKAIGFLKLNIDQPLEGLKETNAMELERIYLLKAATRKGFGAQAIAFCFDLARKMKKKIIWLNSMDSTEALHFYYRLGFSECGSFRLDFEIMKPEFRGMKILMKNLEE
jgi:GNAT superfamily N-acetyltransferase